MSSGTEAVDGFLDEKISQSIRQQFGSPVFVYSEERLLQQAKKALQFPHDSKQPFRVRFAMKACPNAAILQIFDREGLHFDASSGFEALRAVRAGISPEKICLSTQEFPSEDFEELMKLGIKFNACSLHQLEEFGRRYPGGSCGIRFNPGLGSGGTEKTNVGGQSASFGIWHANQDGVKAIAEKHNVIINRIHTHIGSGSDPSVWVKAASLSLSLVESFGTVSILNLGGGFKVARVPEEISTNLSIIGQPIEELISSFCQRTGRLLEFEIEPGTYLTANSGALLTSVQDVTSTGEGGYRFLKIDSGMTEILRPCLYGGQHPIAIYRRESRTITDNNRNRNEEFEYIVVGHCCESGDLLTCAPGEPDRLSAKSFVEVEIGDILVIGGSGAYCSSMSAKNYNSFPEAAEVLIDTTGDFHMIRRRQSMDHMLQNEVKYNPKAS